ncbi:hypothetical protein LCGC14_0231970 [marine sediment metagenome]|uniref:Tape measure protein N-terminal domain-containing protein n=1 Tax=marine sediment metagenome TaxID=412755 RepID=A0A0F9UEI9_9ZZZZ
MVTTLDELQLVLGANTKSLDKAAQTIRSVGTSMDRAADRIDKAVKKIEQGFRSVEKATKGAAVAQSSSTSKIRAQLLRQEKAVASAREQFLNMTASIKRAGQTDPSALGRISRSFKALEARMRSGAMSSRQFAEAQMKFRATLGRSRRSLADFRATQMGATAATVKGRGALGAFSSRFDEFGRAVRVIEGPLGGIAARFQTFGAAIKTVNLKMLAFIGIIAGMILGFVKLFPAIIRAHLELDKIRRTLKFATGSAALAGETFEFLREVTGRLGLNFVAAAEQFSKFAAAARGTSLEGEKVKEVFESVSMAATVLSLTADETAGVFRALQQMVSKGTVQAEELRGQLGERLPGAFILAAKAMGVTTRQLGKMLEQGEVLAEELLPKLSKLLKEVFGPDVIGASNSLRAAIEKLKNEWIFLLDATNAWTGASGLVKSVMNGISSTMKDMSDTINMSLLENKKFMELLPYELSKMLASMQRRLVQLKAADNPIKDWIVELFGGGTMKEAVAKFEAEILKLQKRIGELKKQGFVFEDMIDFEVDKLMRSFFDIRDELLENEKAIRDYNIGMKKLLDILARAPEVAHAAGMSLEELREGAERIRDAWIASLPPAIRYVEALEAMAKAEAKLSKIKRKELKVADPRAAFIASGMAELNDILKDIQFTAKELPAVLNMVSAWGVALADAFDAKALAKYNEELAKTEKRIAKMMSAFEGRLAAASGQATGTEKEQFIDKEIRRFMKGLDAATFTIRELEEAWDRAGIAALRSWNKKELLSYTEALEKARAKIEEFAGKELATTDPRQKAWNDAARQVASYFAKLELLPEQLALVGDLIRQAGNANAKAWDVKNLAAFIEELEKGRDRLAKMMSAFEGRLAAASGQATGTEKEQFIDKEIRKLLKGLDTTKFSIREMEEAWDRASVSANRSWSRKELDKYNTSLDKAVVSVDKLIAGFQAQIDTAGMTEREKAVHAAGLAAKAAAKDYVELGTEVERAARLSGDAWDAVRLDKIFDETRTPLEAFNIEMKELSRLSDEYSDTYGPALERAMKKLRVDLGKTDPVLKSISKGFGDLADGIVDAMNTSGSAMEKFANVVDSIFIDIQKAFLRMAIIKPLQEAIFDFGSSFWDSGSGGVQTELGPGAQMNSALGNVFNRGRVAAFAAGGVINTPTVFPMAKGAGLMGEAGPEAVMPLRRTSSGRLGVEMAGGGGSQVVTVNIIDNAGNDINAESSPDGRGGVRLDVVIDKAVANKIRSGGSTFRAIKDTFNTTVRTSRR